MKDHTQYLNCRERYEGISDHRSHSLKNIQACDGRAVLYQLSYQAN